MSRFFLHISAAAGPPDAELLAGGIQSVITGFEQVDAPVWHNQTTEGATLILAGHDRAIAVAGCSFSTGAALLHESQGTAAAFSSGFTTLSVKCGPDEVEIRSGLIAGRSAWYYQDDTCFIVSSSQRAIIRYLGTFEFNEQAMVWMLATGNLGPGNAWDKRIKHIGVNARLVLELDRWLLHEYRGDVEPDVGMNEDNAKAESDLDMLLSDVFSKVDGNGRSGILALSGGYDSRVVMQKMHRFHGGMDTVTWGLTAAMSEVDSDAFVAAAVANAFGVKNYFFETDFKPKDFASLIDTFLMSGEGRLDHINSFMDGLRMWRKLSSENYRILYRADEVFGWLPCSSEKDVRISLDFHFMEDNSNMLPLQHFGLPAQQVPEELHRRNGESLAGWRDRLYRTFRLPYVLTALHDVESSYMEVFNPLLHNDLVRFCMRLPDQVRTSKKLYAGYVSRLEPRLPFARKSSIPEPAAILRSARFVSCILDEFFMQDCRSLFGRDFLEWIQQQLEVDDELVNRTNDSFVLWMKSQVPWRLKKILRQDIVQYRSDFNQLAFRVFIVSRMKRMLTADAKEGKMAAAGGIS